ncbi:MAG: hypothetical protein BM563_10910 [Bacteroidetes bacterium MedPE-SWsnd-G1]|nr:MAG: hypothetical protein BM563_10910 [Bacteroidetes bacterium MedPE-SWsnd-G1]
MRKIVMIALLLVSTSIAAQETTKTGAFQFENETIDYGTIAKNSDGNRVFTFKNVGEAPIVISKVKVSCGCTVASKPTAPVLPGETAEITVGYDTKRTGGFSKTITVTSNANEVTKVLRIKGNVLKEEKNTVAKN